VFGIITNSATEYFTKFGAYNLTAFFYSVEHLKIREYYVIGRTEEELERILKKINDDPIMQFIIDTYGVSVRPLLHSQMIVNFKFKGVRDVDLDKYKLIVAQASKDWKPPAKSWLHEDVRRAQFAKRAIA
ncbi:MAG: hypothetical protein WCT31_04375, partial [Candidatus Micrarchaeia archaeon]